MTRIHIFTVLIAIENVFCVYRNFTQLSKFWRTVAIARVATMVVTNVGACVELVVTTYDDDTVSRLDSLVMYSYSMLTSANSVLAVLVGLHSARRFGALLAGLGALHRYCGADARYNRRMHNLRRGVFSVIGFLFLAYAITFVISMYQWSNASLDFSTLTVYTGFIHSMLSFWKEIRFQIEFLAFNVFIKALILFVAHLNARLSSLQRSLAAAPERARLRRELADWTAAYETLALCSDGIQECFGVQIAVSLFILMIYLIGLSYISVATIVSKAPGNTGPAVFLLGNYSLAVVLLCRAGQQLHGAARRLRTSLAQLQVTALAVSSGSGSECGRLVRAPARAVRARRVRVRVVARATLGMGLLVAFCSSAVSYTIVLLQFGHVV